MTVAEWLDARTPRAPELLDRQLRAAIADSFDEPADAFPSTALQTAEAIVRDLLLAPPKSREGATALLVADALVTYACEYDAAHPESVDRAAHDAIIRLAALARS